MFSLYVLFVDLLIKNVVHILKLESNELKCKVLYIIVKYTEIYLPILLGLIFVLNIFIF